MAKEVPFWPGSLLREQHGWVGQARVWRCRGPEARLPGPPPGPFGAHPGAASLLLALSAVSWHFQCGGAWLGASTGAVPSLGTRGMG